MSGCPGWAISDGCWRLSSPGLGTKELGGECCDGLPCWLWLWLWLLLLLLWWWGLWLWLWLWWGGPDPDPPWWW